MLTNYLLTSTYQVDVHANLPSVYNGSPNLCIYPINKRLCEEGVGG